MKIRYKILVITLVSVVTLAFHYGWNPFGGGHSHILHSIHGRLCYIPILLAAGWFGLRGGLLGALGISLAVMPFILTRPELGMHDLTAEYTEIFFYFALGALTGWLFDRQRQADDRRIQAERKLAQAERLGLLGRMVAAVAHEIRNPLGSIRGAVEILADDIPPESTKREFIDIIQVETGRLGGIVDSYLEYSVPKPPQREPGDLVHLIRDVLRQFGPEHPAVRLHPELPEMLPARFDAGQIRRVLLNLLDNAADALSSGGEVRLTARAEGDRICIDVVDDGPGLPDVVRARLFQPFVTDKASGSGLGLSLSHEIVKAHGGCLELVPAVPPATGAHFRITLPAGAAEESVS